MFVQLITGKKFNEDYNYSSTLANVIFPYSSFVNAATGSYGEYTFKDGFTLGSKKGFSTSTFETTVGSIGNLGGDQIAKYSISLDRALPKYQQFGYKVLGGTLGNSSSSAILEVK